MAEQTEQSSHMTLNILMCNLGKNPTSVRFASDVILHCVIVSSSERTGAHLIHCIILLDHANHEFLQVSHCLY
jgi:hypothetical protein